MACLSVASHQLTPSAFSLHAVLLFWSLLSNAKLTVHLVHCTSLIFINYHMENITFTATILYVLDVDNLYTMCPDTSDGSFPSQPRPGRWPRPTELGFAQGLYPVAHHCHSCACSPVGPGLGLCILSISRHCPLLMVLHERMKLNGSIFYKSCLLQC